MDQKIQHLGKSIADCIIACNNCFGECLKESDVAMMAECIRLDRECAEICSAALNMLFQDSRFSREVIMLCKNVCIVCKQECMKFNMEHCQQCAAACKACALACEDFLAEHP